MAKRRSIEWKFAERMPFDLLDVAGTVKRHRAYLDRNPTDVVAHANLVMALDLVDAGFERAQRERIRWADEHLRGRRRAEWRWRNDAHPERRLRVGFMSADFRQHSAMYTIAPIIGYLDRTQFEVHAYSSTNNPDHYTQAVAGSAERFFDLRGWTDEQVARLIEQNAVDILIDCSGHSAGFRLEVIARKPAPIILSGWGYPLGTGLIECNYVVGDPIFFSEDERRVLCERVLDMSCVLTYQFPPYTPAVRSGPTMRGDAPVFGSINRMEKISEPCLALWSRILHACPGARMVLKDRHLSEREARRGLLRRFAEVGIESDRLTLLGQTIHAGQLEAFAEVDVQLDTYPQCGGISSAEALVMGVPVVTMWGGMPSARVASSMLTSIGRPEWIARTPEEYERIACELIADAPRLKALRESLRGEVVAVPFGNPQMYTAELGEKLRSIWRQYAEKATRETQAQLVA